MEQRPVAEVLNEGNSSAHQDIHAELHRFGNRENPGEWKQVGKHVKSKKPRKSMTCKALKFVLAVWTRRIWYELFWYEMRQQIYQTINNYGT